MRLCCLLVFLLLQNALAQQVSKSRHSVDLRDYGAVCDLAHDDTPAFRGALASFPDGGVRIHVPSNCRITATITIATAQTYIEGEVPHGTFLLFAPSGDGAAFSFHASAGADSERNGISDLMIYSPDMRFTKTAIEVVAGNSIEIHDVHTMGAGPKGRFLRQRFHGPANPRPSGDQCLAVRSMGR